MALDPNLASRVSSYFATRRAPIRVGALGAGTSQFDYLPRQSANPIPLGNSSEAPQNVGQWLLNLLGTGTYVTSNIANEYTRAVRENLPTEVSGDAAGNVTHNADIPGALWEIATAPITGLARGLGEGVGLRFDRDGDGYNERPRTWGQNLEDWGAYQWVNPDDEGQVFAQGAISTAADILLDPLTYVSFGATAAIKGAAKGAAAAIKGAEEGGALINGLRGARTGWIDGRAAEQAARAARAENRQLRADFQQQIRDGLIAKRDIPQIRTILGRAGVSRGDLTPEVMSTIAAQVRHAKDADVIDPDVLVKPASGLPARDVADALAPTLQGTRKVVPTPEQVKAAFEGALVRGAAAAAKAVPVEAPLEAAVREVSTSAAPDLPTVQAAIAGLEQVDGGRALLSSKVPGGGQTVRELLTDIHTRRLSGGDPASLQRTLDRILAGTGATRATFDPPRLAETVQAKFGHTLTQEDLARFLATPNPDKLDVLRQIVGGPQAVQYADFAAALQGAARGELTPDAMRKMAAAVGVSVPAGARAPELRTLLKTEGAFNWAQITGAVRTEGRVLAEQGFDAAEAAAAKTTDVAAAKEAAGAAFAAKIGERTASRRGMGAYAAIRALGEVWAKRLDEGVESFDLLSNQTMRTVFSAATKAMQPTATKASGAARATFGREVTEVIRLVEDWADSVGSTPHVYGSSWSDTYFIRFSEILDGLGGAADTALWAPLTYRKVASSSGLSVYPTTLARAAAEALKHAEQGFTPEQIAFHVASTIVADSRRVRNAFIDTAAGKEAVEAVSERMADPAFTGALLAAHTARKPIAAAMSLDVAGRVVTPIGNSVIRALEKAAGGGDRAEVFALIDEGWNTATALRGGKEPGHLVDDIARERLNQGFLHGVLGEAGARVFKADTRAARANNPGGAVQSGAAARKAAEEAQATLQRRGPRAGREGAAQATRRGQQAQAAVKGLDDAAQTHSEIIDDWVKAGEIADTPLARIEALFELENAYGNARIFHKLGVALEGSYGQADLKGLAVAVNGNTFRLSGLYADDMVRWAKKVGYDSDPARVTSWWRALARMPLGASDDTLRELLATGVRADPTNPLARTAVPPLPAEDIDRALELKQFIDVIFSEGSHGMFARSGVIASDLAKELGRINFRDGADQWAKFDLDRNINLADQTGLWRTWDLESGDDVLDVLVRYHTALQASSVKPSIGASLTRHFGHVAEHLTPAQAAAAGWKKVDTTVEDADLARFLDPDAYFPPEIIKQMSYLEGFLNSSRRFDGKLGQYMDVYDSILSVLKSANTIWRPGHHVTNILGETFMNLMAGVNPLRYRKGVAVMRAGGHLTDADVSPLARYNASNTPEGFAVKESFDSDAVQIVVKGADGKKAVQSIDPAAVWQAALDHSVAMTHGLAEDILAPTMSKLNPSIGRRALSPVIAGNEALMRFSAARDNVFRLTHFVDALEKGQFSSLDDAFRRAAKIVHDYHPTMQTLSAFEQKYMRRLVFFYTWQRQAISRVLRTALDRPGVVTMPSKLMYNMAEANGLEPESYGKPVPDDPRIASYGSSGLLGPSFTGGLTPFEEGNNLWGFSLSAPQIDGIQALFKGLTMKPEDGLGNVGNLAAGFGESLASQLPPILKAPIELSTGNKIGGGQIDDVGDYLLGQTGLPAQLSNALGGNAKPNAPAAQNQADAQRSLLNLLTGLKFTNYTSPTSARSALQEQVEAWRKLNGG